MKVSILFACSLFIVLNAPRAFALVGGEMAKGTKGNGIFSIMIKDSENERGPRGFCTATKISPRVFITAAHCFMITEFPTVDGFEVKKIIIHPSYNADFEQSKHRFDIALVVVEPNKEFASNKTVAIDYHFVEPGSDIVIWGFGCQTSGNEKGLISPVKKFGLSKAEKPDRLSGKFGMATESVHHFQDKLYKDNFLSLGFNLSKRAQSLCHGDSGGPVTKSGKLVGINSVFLTHDMEETGASKSGLSDINFHARLSSLKDWITERVSSF
jgi:hypothetical protein